MAVERGDQEWVSLHFHAPDSAGLTVRLISALYLDVLQTIVLSDSTPEVLLRINGKEISRLLEPQSGLSAVFQSANFDSQAVRAKLDSIPGAGRACKLTIIPRKTLHESVLIEQGISDQMHLSLSMSSVPNSTLFDILL